MTNADGIEIIQAMESDREKAEWYLLHYDDELIQYQKGKQMHLTQLNSQAIENIGGGKGNLPGAPTEAKAIRSAIYDEEHEAYLWLKAVEFACKTLGERKNIFVRVRCEAEKSQRGKRGRHAWVTCTARRYHEEIEKRFMESRTWPGDRTVRTWWAGIIDLVAGIHVRLEKK